MFNMVTYSGRVEVIKGEEFARAFACGGGVEYLHRNRASRRRRWKGKSRIFFFFIIIIIIMAI
jgi:hypothetical protein